jgi:hypothetical protein
MAKVIAITDLKGQLLGVVRADPVAGGHGVIAQAVPMNHPEQRSHIIEVADNLLGKPSKGVERLNVEVASSCPRFRNVSSTCPVYVRAVDLAGDAHRSQAGS